MLYCPNFFWNVLQVWMTGKDVYLQMTWSWPDKTWNILCSYCLQWNTSQSKFRNHYFLFLFAFYLLSQLFLIWGCIYILNPSSWILSHLQESAKNTSLPSLFDPLTLALSILILFYLSVFFLFKEKHTHLTLYQLHIYSVTASFSWKTNTSFLFSILSTCFL